MSTRPSPISLHFFPSPPRPAPAPPPLLPQADANVEEAWSLYRQMQEEGLVPNRVVCNSLLAVFSTAGAADDALGLFE